MHEHILYTIRLCVCSGDDAITTTLEKWTASSKTRVGQKGLGRGTGFKSLPPPELLVKVWWQRLFPESQSTLSVSLHLEGVDVIVWSHAHKHAHIADSITMMLATNRRFGLKL